MMISHSFAKSANEWETRRVITWATRPLLGRITRSITFDVAVRLALQDRVHAIQPALNVAEGVIEGPSGRPVDRVLHHFIPRRVQNKWGPALTCQRVVAVIAPHEKGGQRGWLVVGARGCPVVYLQEQGLGL